ncbi:MAG: glycoside hydrolase family 3 C-terminal domain-containing protein [Acidobacteriota bacterium]|nr:glycoside hydrolase family 3 C-terminal domain-containing protein [Acidobacteriota bacterium]
MRRRYAPLALVLLMAGCSRQQSAFPWQDPKLPPEKRAQDRLNRMSRAEKVDLLSGRALPTFPVPPNYPAGLTAAASWDPDLVGQVADALANEAIGHERVDVLGPDLQSYGEDQWLASRMGVAFVGGVQGEGIVATPRLFPATWQDERVLRETRLPAFRAAVEEAGAWSMMAAGGDPHLLTDILRNEWGFKGFVLSDGSSGPDGAAAAKAGIDIGMANPSQLPGGTIDEKARTILRALFASGAFDPRVVQIADRSAERYALIHKLDAEGIVLLKNAGNALPLDAAKVHSIAIVGKGSWDELRSRAGTLIEVKVFDPSDAPAAVAAAKKADIAIVAADRNMPGNLISQIAGANPRTVVVLTEGPAAGVERWRDSVRAILCGWNIAGLAPVLFGDVDASGRLPVTYAKEMPKQAGGLYPGYRYFDEKGIEPIYPFGFGLSYSQFEYSDLKIFPATPRYGETINVVLRVRNTGSRTASDVVQLYLHQAKPNVERPVRELRGFRRVTLKADESTTVSMVLDRRSLWFFDPAPRDWVTQPGVYEVSIGASSRDIRLKGSFELFE